MIKYTQCPNCRHNMLGRERFCDKCGAKIPKGNIKEFDSGIEPKSWNEIKAETNAKNGVTCPYCKSTNCSKIGVVGRSVSFGLFGFGSGKVGKQWHCNACKSDF